MLERLEEDFIEVFYVKPVSDLKYDWMNDNPDFWGIWGAPLVSYSK